MLRTSTRVAAWVLLAGGLAMAEDVKPVVVAPTGGDFTTVQAAIDAVPKNDPTPRTILIKPGTYKELVKVGKGQSHLTLKGDGKTPADTVLTYDWFAKSVDPKTNTEVGTRGSASTVIEGNDITCENLTFENTAGDVGQAVALRTAGDRLVFRDCRMLGWQDTLYANDGRNYYDRCYIEGRVDFIFGRAVAVFDRCEIHSKNGGFVTAASTNESEPFGYVFLDCKLTGDDTPYGGPNAGQSGKKTPGTSLGRPWRPMASTTFIRCEMGPHIKPEGWAVWNDDKGQPKPARYAEYGSTGPGGDVSKRVAWSKQLTKAEADAITVQSVLAGKDGWDPTK